jgi:hypothetical protein
MAGFGTGARRGIRWRSEGFPIRLWANLQRCGLTYLQRLITSLTMVVAPS